MSAAFLTMLEELQVDVRDKLASDSSATAVASDEDAALHEMHEALVEAISALGPLAGVDRAEPFSL